MKPLKITTLFHLNLAYSSIEEDDRINVIDRCYHPLLALIDKLRFPAAIEASAYTLEEIARWDPAWIAKLAELVAAGVCQIIASGYSQAIGPLLPAEVNAANLAIGNKRYLQLLGTVPRIVLVNEQAFSTGMIAHYLDAGFSAMVMEWNNPALTNCHWHSEWRYLPQYACDQHGRKIPVIWNNSIFFQKFQHYVHGEKELDEYLDYVASHQYSSLRVFPLYGNDIEIFNFRPGRYHTEAQLGSVSEWLRIEELFQRLLHDERFEIIAPVDVLEFLSLPGAGNDLALETAAAPIPVKKQEKYNITRWAVTGRDDLGINSACQRIFASLKMTGNDSDEAWKELCYLWSSDFRTHITESRWRSFRERLAAAEALYCNLPLLPSPVRTLAAGVDTIPDEVSIIRKGRILSIGTDRVRLDLNTRRGLAIDGLWFTQLFAGKLCGTLPHGYYDDITLGADFYSGHLIFETTGRQKITDLESVEPSIQWDAESRTVIVTGMINSPLGPIVKQLQIHPENASVRIGYELRFDQLPVGSLRLGHLTMMPESFNRDSLFYRTHNGGVSPETFFLGNNCINHGEPASFLVSAKNALGLTDGKLEIGDSDKSLVITIDRGGAALVGLVNYAPLRNTFFSRISFSAREMDETSRATQLDGPLRCNITLTGSKR